MNKTTIAAILSALILSACGKETPKPAPAEFYSCSGTETSKMINTDTGRLSEHPTTKIETVRVSILPEQDSIRVKFRDYPIGDGKTLFSNQSSSRNGGYSSTQSFVFNKTALTLQMEFVSNIIGNKYELRESFTASCQKN